MSSNISKTVGYLFIVITLAICSITILEAGYFFYDNISSKNKQLPISTNLSSANLTSLGIAFDNKYSADELSEMYLNVGDHLKYRPWTQFGNYDHHNKYSIVENGIRKTIINSCSTSKKISIWFFGGSTTYGIGVPWWNSIPSEFVNYAKTQGKCIEAVNYGVPYFFSMQEVAYFANMLIKSSDTNPDFAIFLDGLNDFGQPGSSINAEPFFTPVLEASIPHKNIIEINMKNGNQSWLHNLFTYRFIKYKVLNHVAETNTAETNKVRNNYEIPFSNQISSTQDAATKIVKNYVSTTKVLSGLCQEFKINCIQFLQPIAVKDYYPREGMDTLTVGFRTDPNHAQKRALFIYGYKYLNEMRQKNARQYVGATFFDISDVFKDYNGLAYVDSGHYSPGGSIKIAKTMYSYIFQ
jgi:hypothetical protein